MMRRTLRSGLAALTLVAIAAPGWASGRLSDKEALQLMEEVAQGVRDVSDAIPRESRSETVAAAEGETELRGLLQELVGDTEEMRKSLRSGRSGSTQVKELLLDARALQDRVSSGAGLFGAEDAWHRLYGRITLLGQAYGVDLEADPSTWDVYRLNDKAVRSAVETLGPETRQFLNAFRREIKKMDSIAGKDEKQAIEYVKSLMTSAGELRDELIHSRDVTSELGSVVTSAASITTFLAQYDFSIDTQRMWKDLSRKIEGIAASLREN